jgi:hypothetical protein
MPNWVYNKVEIEGDDAVLDLVAQTVRNDTDDTERNSLFSYQKIIPCPPDVTDWYNWNNSNWGVKWDATDVETLRTPGRLAYRMSSPWAPPVPVMAKLSEQFPILKITHTYEEEQGWGGIIKYSAGVPTENRTWEIPDSHAEIVRRGGDCYCDDSAYFKDCYSERARALTDLDARTREAAVSLGIGWSGTFEELLDAAARL